MPGLLGFLVRRWQFAGIALLAVIFLTYHLVPSSSQWSLDRLSANVGVSSSIRPHSQEFETAEIIYTDGTQRFDRRRRKAALQTAEAIGRDRGEQIPAAPRILFLVLTKNSKSWSRDNDTSPPRTVDDLLSLLHSTGLDIAAMSLAIMTAEPSEYDAIVAATAGHPFARVTVILREPDKQLHAISGIDRHDGSIQGVRRAALARLRNHLMTSALEAEDHIVWMDADIIDLSPGVVQTMVTHAETNETAGIITALCRKISHGNYDQNAFRTNNADWVEHVVPEEKFDEANSAYLSMRTGVQDLIKETSDDALVSLSSVGGTLLYIRASLVRYGLMFPWYNVIGTTWAKQGWMGLETEGLCWSAQFLEGGGCYTLGGSHFSLHAE